MAWYSFDDLRSHNCIMSFVLSNRGGGKTYGAKMIGIKDYLKKGEQFVYVRRHVSEFDTVGQFFDDIVANEEFENYPLFDKEGKKMKDENGNFITASYEFCVIGQKGFIRQKVDEGEEQNDWNVLCYFIPLSVANKYKSTPYPLVTKIFYDEVIIDTTGNQNYLKNEERILMELMSTIIRKRSGVKFFGMANNVSLVNPHFTFWNIQVNPHQRFTKSPNGKIVVELFTDSDFIAEMESTEFGSLIADTEYGKYAIHNESLCDNPAFVSKRPSHQIDYKIGFIVEGYEIHCWYDAQNKKYFIDQTGIGKTNNKLFAVTDQDFQPDVKSIKIAKTMYITKHLKIHYQCNAISYNNLTTQSLFNTLVKYI